MEAASFRERSSHSLSGLFDALTTRFRRTGRLLYCGATMGSDALRKLSERPAPVCITGMHRSGTSTVSQLLHHLGLYLGRRDEDLAASGPANPDGYWENRRFVEVNEGILRALGSGWDVPRPLEEDWWRAESLSPLRAEAESLIGEFDGFGPWGWKDPRSSLTLPFWMGLLPDLKVVTCLRNSLEVAYSLRNREFSSLTFGLNLWRTYNERLRETLPEGRYLVTHYEAYYHRPQQELRRVLEFARIPASDQLVALVRSRVIKGLRHHFFTVEELLERDPTGRVRDLYIEMCDEAGWDPDPTPAASILSL